MALYQRGSQGPEVARIQARLAGLGHYLGPTDGLYGGGSEAAVRAFQRAAGLAVDGTVGPATWRALFAEPIAAPAIAASALDYRCLALTGSFETSAPPPECFAGLTGDFDGQGISFGALQWNFGQGSLQPLLYRMRDAHGGVLRALFDVYTDEFLAVLGADTADQLAWARAIQNSRREVVEPWRGLLKSLGRTPEFQAIEREAAAALYREALALCREYGLRSQRAVALMFDIMVQNGSIPPHVAVQIRRDVEALEPGVGEEAALRIIAVRRAEASKARWIEAVRRRKLAIAEGHGVVNGATYDLEAQYGITLAAVPGLP